MLLSNICKTAMTRYSINIFNENDLIKSVKNIIIFYYFSSILQLNLFRFLSELAIFVHFTFLRSSIVCDTGTVFLRYCMAWLPLKIFLYLLIDLRLGIFTTIATEL